MPGDDRDVSTHAAADATLDEVVADKVIRQIIRRFAPSAWRVRDLDPHRRSFTEMRPCKERRLVAKLYVDLGLEPLAFGTADVAGALYVRASSDAVRAALVAAYGAHDLAVVKAKRFKTASPAGHAPPETWLPDAVLLLEPGAEGDGWMCVGSREWELVEPARNALASALSAHLPVLALLKADGFRAIAVHANGACTSDRIVESADGVVTPEEPSVTDALIQRVFGAPPPAPAAALTPFDFDDAGFAQSIEGILDAHMDDDAGTPIPELMLFGARRAKKG